MTTVIPGAKHKITAFPFTGNQLHHTAITPLWSGSDNRYWNTLGIQFLNLGIEPKIMGPDEWLAL